MNIRNLTIGTLTVLAAGLAFPASALSINSFFNNETEGRVCTMEAKMCPDGSFVGRMGPNCEFPVCPGAGNGSNNSEVDVSGSGSVNANVSESAQVNSNANAEIHFGLGSLIMTRADVRSNTVIATSRDWANVRSDADLSGYIAAQIENDENIEKVQVSPANVVVTYKQNAHFLGFVPTTIAATAMVDARGDVSVSYPWYSFMFATENDIEAKLESRAMAVLDAQADASAEADTRLAADTRARLVAEIRAILEEEFNAGANANVNASGTVNVQ